MITFIHSFFKIDLPLKIIVSRTKIHILFTYFLSEIIQQITKNILFLLNKQTRIWCIFHEKLSDLAWLGLNGKAKTVESVSFNFGSFFSKINEHNHVLFLQKTHDFKDFPKFFSLPTFCTYETNTISTQCRSFYKFSARYQFSYCVRVIKFYVFSKKS